MKDFHILNTWELVLLRLKDCQEEPVVEKKIDIIIEILVNLRLLDKEEKIPDKREKKEHIDSIYKDILKETTVTLESVATPTNEFLYYFRELLKKLPLRSQGNNLIEEIRSAAEHFEESRDSDDPFYSFAGDLRKEAHRKLSPKIISKYITPYLELVQNKNPVPMREAGYFALSSKGLEVQDDSDFIELAQELKEKFSYLWDYENGDIIAVKKSLERSEELFERCFLKKEVQAFLALLNPDYISQPQNLYDCLRRLTSLKKMLKESFLEKRIDFYDYINLDLDLGRLIFIFTNDLSNNHYDNITIQNISGALTLLSAMISILKVKGILLENNEHFLKDLKEIKDAGSLDILRARRAIQNISNELQDFHKNTIFNRLGHILNKVLEAYEIPTSDLSPIKDRFFNNFIRRTESHVVSDFIEKLVAFFNKELATRNMENSLYGKQKIVEIPEIKNDMEKYLAATWKETPDDIRIFLGGKGNSIIDMNNLKISIPPAFILGLPICHHVYNLKKDFESFRLLIKKSIRGLEEVTQKQMGNPHAPLLVSMRSGSSISLPGAMCTILNVGIIPSVREALAKKFGENFANEIYLRFLSNTLSALHNEKSSSGSIEEKEKRIKESLGEKFLTDIEEQILKSIELVFFSSKFEKVKEHLKELSIELNYGTTVTVQQMVFGNKNKKSSSGVVFTRNPTDGKNELFGEYKEMIQGEDVVMGNIITKDIHAITPTIKNQLKEYKQTLEKYLRHELDIEFTVEDGKLFLLQTRRASLSPYAKFIVNIDMLKEKIIDLEEFKLRLERLSTTNPLISVPKIDEDHKKWNPPIGEGVPISQGIVSGFLVLTHEKFEECRQKRENIIFFTLNTKPSDFYFINNSSGIVTVYPGGTSHAAITAMTLHKPCIVGCSNALIDSENKLVTFKGKAEDIILKEGELMTLDANSGQIYKGTVSLLDSMIQTHDIWENVQGIIDADKMAQNCEEIIKKMLQKSKQKANFKKLTLDKLSKKDLEGKNVLVRLDFNVPFKDKKILDDTQIKAAMPTIEMLFKMKATPVLASHLGDPGKQEIKGVSREEIYQEFSLDIIAEYLKNFYPDIVFHEGSIASSGVLIGKEEIQKGKINLLENLRFAIGEKENDDAFAGSLAHLSDGYYVNDSFNVSHRRNASIDAVTKYMHTKVAGPLLKKELQFLGKVLRNPAIPFVAIFGGEKLSIKLGAIESLLPKVEHLIFGGAIANTFLRAKGIPVANSLIEETMIPVAKKLLELYGDKIILPHDFVFLSATDKTIIDIGDSSLEKFKDILKKSNTIFYNGPLGKLPIEDEKSSTKKLIDFLDKLSQEDKTVIATGVNTTKSIRKMNLAEKITHVSTGGLSALEFIERLTLLGIQKLDND